VAKDAIRLLVKDRYGLVLCPADITIATDQHGCPIVQGEFTESLDCHLILSIAHTEGRAVALVGVSSDESGVGIDVETIGQRHSGLENGALTTQEQTLLSVPPPENREEWLLRLWSAKEALAKAVGRGMAGSPFNLIVQDIDTETGRVTISLAGELAHLFSKDANRLFTIFTGKDDHLIFASSHVQLTRGG
jgi:phosphopantetheine--protein transferase-like protein